MSTQPSDHAVARGAAPRRTLVVLALALAVACVVCVVYTVQEDASSGADRSTSMPASPPPDMDWNSFRVVSDKHSLSGRERAQKRQSMSHLDGNERKAKREANAPPKFDDFDSFHVVSDKHSLSGKERAQKRDTVYQSHLAGNEMNAKKTLTLADASKTQLSSNRRRRRRRRSRRRRRRGDGGGGGGGGDPDIPGCGGGEGQVTSDCTLRTSCRKLKSAVGKSCAVRLENAKKLKCPGGDASVAFEGFDFKGQCVPCANKDPKIRPNKQAVACGVTDKALGAVVKAAKYISSPVRAVKDAVKAGKLGKRVKNGMKKVGKKLKKVFRV